MVLPMVAMMAAMMLMFSGSTRPGAIRYVIYGLFGVGMLGMVVAGVPQRRGARASGRWATPAGGTCARLAQHRVRLSDGRHAAARRDVVPAPDPATLWSLAASYRLWERRARTTPTSASCGSASGRRASATTLITPDTKPLEQLEPLSALALRRFITTYYGDARPAARHGGQRVQPGPRARRPRPRRSAWCARCWPSWRPCTRRTTCAIAVCAEHEHAAGVGVGQVAAARAASGTHRRARPGAAGRARPITGAGGDARRPARQPATVRPRDRHPRCRARTSWWCSTAARSPARTT